MAKIGPLGNLNYALRRVESAEAIIAEGLACQRGGRAIISGISFTVSTGSALALRGPNGSGKTTLLRTIAGYLQPAAGSISVRRPPHSVSLPKGREDARTILHLGERAAAPSPSPLGVRAGVRGDSDEGVYHYIGHANGIKPRFSVIENVSFWQRFYSGSEDIAPAEEALEAFGLLNLASFYAGHLSQGQARRLGLARLLAAHRPVWLLDEPSVSLDAASTRLLERAIATHLSSGGIAIVSTHLDLALPDAQILELSGPAFAP
ncbi:MAG: ATP-binding cassette domain-containing protein [Rhodomicrobium sp.]